MTHNPQFFFYCQAKNNLVKYRVLDKQLSFLVDLIWAAVTIH